MIFGLLKSIHSLCPLTLLVLCQVYHCSHSWHRSQCSPHTPCTPCTGPTSTCACLVGTSCSSLPFPLARPPGLHPWLWPCSPHQTLYQANTQTQGNKKKVHVCKTQHNVCPRCVGKFSHLSLPDSWLQCLYHTGPCYLLQRSTLHHFWSEHMYGPFPWQPALQSDLSGL